MFSYTRYLLILSIGLFLSSCKPNHHDDLIGKFAIKENGKPAFIITKENEQYFCSFQNEDKSGWAAPEKIDILSNEQFKEMFGENWKSFTKAGLFGVEFFAFIVIVKVKEGYRYKDHTFKTGYAIQTGIVLDSLPGYTDLYKISNKTIQNFIHSLKHIHQ